MTSLTQLPQWQVLNQHHQEWNNVSLTSLFENDNHRFEKFSLETADLLLDYSKNHLNEQTITLLCELAQAVNLKQQIEAMFNGEIVNLTEQRPALHTALRNLSEQPILVNGEDVMPGIQQTLAKMATFSEQIRKQNRITDIVNIGIGGSDLGPHMVIEALNAYVTTSLRFHFVNNVDSSCITQVLQNLNPATTLFIISSKSFTTIETLTNAKTALAWFQQNSDNQTDITQHFIAITSKPHLAIELGIAAHNIFKIEDWVGGRYSLWSATGLPIMLAIGFDQFKQLLTGAHAMDEHFRHTEFSKNMPVILGLLNVWYNNFFGTRAHAILPYSHLLKKLPLYLQQAEMESTGKNTTMAGIPVNYATGQIIFGDSGINSQHTFCQLLQQGTSLIPVDFIVPIRNFHALANHHAILIASALSQSKALAENNRPSHTLLMPELSPHTLGALIALYEHKIFVQSVIWQINAFDQNGVELSKQLVQALLPNLIGHNTQLKSDSSTTGLVKYYQAKK